MYENSIIPKHIQEEIEAYNNPIIKWDNSFEVPNYVLSEIDEYYRKGKPITKWSNVIALMNLAKMNNRLTEEQIEYLTIKFR